MADVAGEQSRNETAATVHDRLVIAEIGRKIHSLTKARRFKRFTDAVAFLILLVGVYFTYEEARRGNTGEVLTNWSDITARTIDVDKAFLDHPELQKYFYNGAIVKRGQPDYDRTYALSILELDFLDSVTVRLAYNKGHISRDVLQPDAWYKFIMDLMSTAPLMCDILLAAPDTYGTELRRVGVPPCAAARLNRRRAAVVRPSVAG